MIVKDISNTSFSFNEFTNIRSIALIGQSLTLLFYYHFLIDDVLNLALILSTIGVTSLFISICLSIFLIKKGKIFISESSIFKFIIFDFIQIIFLIGVHGGLENPFIFIILAPLAISATYLSFLRNLVILCLNIFLIILISYFYIPFPMELTSELEKFGRLASMFICLIFTAFYLIRFTKNSKKLSSAYQQAQSQLQNEKELLKVGGMAAAAVHELGTPLNTINLIVNDFERDKEITNKYKDDVITLNEQLNRIKSILTKLSRNPLSNTRAEELELISLDAYIESIKEKFIENYSGKNVDFRTNDSSENEIIKITPELNIAISNIVNNALSFAKTTVTIIGESFSDYYSIVIKDDGPGFDSKFLQQFGKPYLSSRKNTGTNMGLGLFISIQMIESLGGSVQINNKNGAEVKLVWPKKK